MKAGEIIKLGDHRLICGDCKDSRIVQKLVGKDKVRAVITDPPYGVNYVKGKDWVGLRGGKGLNHKNIQGDDLVGDDYMMFTRKWIEEIKDFLLAKNAFYIFNSDLMICDLRKGMEAAKIYYSQMIMNLIVQVQQQL